MERKNSLEAMKETYRRHGLHPPQTLTIAITGACNLSCGHCWVEAGEATSPPHVPTETASRILTEFAHLGGAGVRITGGEPLCHPCWLEILQHARALGLVKIILQTNALLLSTEHVHALRKLDIAELTVQVSLDGACAESHDLVRGSGAFAGAVAGIRRLVDGGLGSHVVIAFTEMRHNLDEIPALLELAAEIGVPSVVTGTLINGGRAKEGPVLAPPAPDQYLRLIERFDGEKRFRDLYEEIGTVAALEWRQGDSRRAECCTFAENPYLTPDGRLYPCLLCHTDHFAVPDVYGKGLTAAFVEAAPLWADLLRLSRRRATELSACTTCPGRLSCAGGCMGRAWGSCGDLLAADDRCDTRRRIYQTRDLARTRPHPAPVATPPLMPR